MIYVFLRTSYSAYLDLFVMVAREQARAATIMFLRCFFVFLLLFIFFIFFRARASARSDHYVFALFFRIPFYSRAGKRAQRPLCFCAVFSYYYGRARASARSDHYVFALFFRIPFFFYFFFIFYFFIFFVL
jgi:hypothetical protein